MQNNTLKSVGTVLTFVVPAYILYIWFTVHSQYFSFGNNSWLLIAATRLLNGQSLVEHIYESNPPLSIIIYIPHVIFSWIINLPSPIAAYYVTTAEMLASLILSTLIIKKFDFLSFNQKLLILISFLIAMMMSAGIFISEREHLIFIWLIPFLLCQFAITEKIKIPTAIYVPSLIIGSIMLLVKPHYGIIPACLFLIRMLRHRKTFSITKDIDFIILTAITILYIIFLFAISDYGTKILPDVINLYSTPTLFPIVLNIILDYLIISFPLLLIEMFMNDVKGTKKHFINLFHLCMFLSFIPYFIQMKGFPNHIIPVYGFFILALSTSLIMRVNRFPNIIKPLSPFICASSILGLILYYTPPSTKTLTHKDAENLEVVNYIKQNCPTPCTYFAFHADMEIFNSVSAYTNMENGTRYGSYWWLLKLYHKDKNANLSKSIQPAKKKFSRLIEEDFKNYEPDLLLIAKDIPLGNNYDLNFIEYFSEYSKLDKIIKNNYKKTEEISFTFKDYYKGTNFQGIKGGYKYDVYKRTGS